MIYSRAVWALIAILGSVIPVWGQAVSLGYSVMWGTTNLTDFGVGLAVDRQGCAYVVGARLNAATQDSDVFVRKLSPDGKAVVYDRVIGGSGYEIPGGIAVDAAGNAYITGTTASLDFPVKDGVLQSQRLGDMDAFVAKLDPQGRLLWATLVGGIGNEQGRAIAVGTDGVVYATGITSSPDLLTPGDPEAPPQPGVLQPQLRGNVDAYIVKINATGTDFVYRTYLGGNGADAGLGIAVDRDGSACVMGVTQSDDFPTKNPVQLHRGGGQDAFVAKLNATGANLVFSTYLGGSDDEVVDLTTALATAAGIALDGQGNVFVSGDTKSADFPVTSGAWQRRLMGQADGFVVKLTPLGQYVYATYVGGTSGDSAYAIAVDTAGRAVIAGGTYSTDFPVTVPTVQPRLAGQNDVFLARLNSAGSALEFSTFFGGTDHECANAVALGPSGEALVTGITSSTDFPTTAPGPLSSISAFALKFTGLGTAATSVVFASEHLDTQGNLVLVLRIPPNRTFVLESSSNLRDWVPAQQVSSSSGLFELSLKSTRRLQFFRAVAQ